MWSEVAILCNVIGWYYGAAFVAFMAFCTFFMLNIITGLFVASSGKADQDMELRRAEKAQFECLRAVFEQAFHHAHGLAMAQAHTNTSQVSTSSSDAMIDYATFVQFASDPNKQEMLQELDIGQVNAATLFNFLDEESMGVIDLEDLTSGLLRLKRPSTHLDTKTLMFENKKRHEDVNKELAALSKVLCLLDTKVNNLCEMSRQARAHMSLLPMYQPPPSHPSACSTAAPISQQSTLEGSTSAEMQLEGAQRKKKMKTKKRLPNADPMSTELGSLGLREAMVVEDARSSLLTPHTP